MTIAVRPAASSRNRWNSSCSASASIARGGLVEDQHLGVAHEGARDRELLPLAGGEVLPALEPAAEHGVVALRQRRDEPLGAAPPRGLGDARPVVRVVGVPEADVLGGGELVADEVLEHGADPGPEVAHVEVAQVHAAVEDLALGRLVEPQEQLHERALPGAVLADEPERLAGLEHERHVPERPARRCRGSGRRRSAARSGAARRGGSARGGAARALAAGRDGEEREEVRHVERVLVRGPERAEDRLDGALALAEDRDVERQVAERDLRRAPRATRRARTSRRTRRARPRRRGPRRPCGGSRAGGRRGRSSRRASR